jgi:hypothetical protein
MSGPSAHLKEQVRRLRLPSHLLLLDEPAADDLINRRFGDRGRNHFAVPATIAIVGNQVGLDSR